MERLVGIVQHPHVDQQTDIGQVPLTVAYAMDIPTEDDFTSGVGQLTAEFVSGQELGKRVDDNRRAEVGVLTSFASEMDNGFFADHGVTP
ncbi:hypothetical protein D3C80_1815170 [compost metagenome]